MAATSRIWQYLTSETQTTRDMQDNNDDAAILTRPLTGWCKTTLVVFTPPPPPHTTSHRCMSDMPYLRPTVVAIHAIILLHYTRTYIAVLLAHVSTNHLTFYLRNQCCWAGLQSWIRISIHLKDRIRIQSMRISNTAFMYDF
jgi:hypothetical protein